MKKTNPYDVCQDVVELNSGLSSIELTSGMNGYPQNLRPAIIGFETFADAEKMEEELRDYGAYIAYFKQRDGWSLWEEKGNAYEAFNIYDAKYKETCQVYDKSSIDDFDEFVKNEFLYDDFSDKETFDSRLEFFNDLYESISELDDDEFIYVDNGVISRPTKKITMSYHEDVWRETIGIAFFEADEDE